jgi:hypothetical protein
MKQQRKPTSKESSRSDPGASRSLRSACNAAQNEGRWVAAVVFDALGFITNCYHNTPKTQEAPPHREIFISIFSSSPATTPNVPSSAFGIDLGFNILYKLTVTM